MVEGVVRLLHYYCQCNKGLSPEKIDSLAAILEKQDAELKSKTRELELARFLQHNAEMKLELALVQLDQVNKTLNTALKDLNQISNDTVARCRFCLNQNICQGRYEKCVGYIYHGSPDRN